MSTRCKWVNMNNPLYIKYHDEEWGKPSHDDAYLFEILLLENFQAGLSWECVLNKRENFRKAFSNFDYKEIALYDANKIDELMKDRGIIRNRLKIAAAVSNAQAFMDIQKEYGSFANFIWSFTNGQVIKGNGIDTTSDLSDQISLHLRKHKMLFVGSTIIYSYLQAIGVINDHDNACEFKK